LFAWRKDIGDAWQLDWRIQDHGLVPRLVVRTKG
jgi:hypothetical protein